MGVFRKRYRWTCTICGKKLRTNSPSRQMQLSMVHAHINEAFAEAMAKSRKAIEDGRRDRA